MPSLEHSTNTLGEGCVPFTRSLAREPASEHTFIAFHLRLQLWRIRITPLHHSHLTSSSHRSSVAYCELAVLPSSPPFELLLNKIPEVTAGVCAPAAWRWNPSELKKKWQNLFSLTLRRVCLEAARNTRPFRTPFRNWSDPSQSATCQICHIVRLSTQVRSPCRKTYQIR